MSAKTLPIELNAEDEYMYKLCGHIEEHKRIMIRAEYGGCGKSYMCKSMEQRGHQFRLPHQPYCQRHDGHGCALNRFFGVGLV